MTSLLGKQAVVVGAGISGLAAGGALADYFEHVTLLDRDALPSGPMARVGTPQARHLHVLLAGGQRALEALFPGFTAALVEAGAVPLRTGLDFMFEMPASTSSRSATSVGTLIPCRGRSLNTSYGIS